MQLEMPLPRHTSVRFLAGLILCCSFAWGGPKPDAATLFHSVPLRFEQDAKGQWSARGAGYALGLGDSSLNLRVPGGLVRLSFEGARGTAKWQPSGKMLAPTNYFIGDTFRSANAFSHLRRPNLYPGIDVVYY